MEKINLMLIEDSSFGKLRAGKILGDNFNIHYININYHTSDPVKLIIRKIQELTAEGKAPRVLVTNLTVWTASPTDGLTIIKSVQELFPDIIIAVWTKHNLSDLRRNAIKLGAKIFFTKYSEEEKNMATKIMSMLK